MKVVPEGTKLGSDAMVAGFHGIGATGYWTVKFLVNELKAKRTCFIDYENAPAVASSSEGRIVTPYEVYTFGNLSFLKAEVSPVRERENEFYREIADWVISSGVREVALVGGLDESLKADPSPYKVVMTSAFARNGGLGEEPALDDDKMIVGPVASMLNYFEMRSFPAFAVLAYSNTERVDPRAAATSAEFLAKRYRLRVDTSPLIKGAEVIESELKVIQEKDKEPSGSVYS
jgi:predicted ATP-grasp superfamily ATP-dependent carboligase